METTVSGGQAFPQDFTTKGIAHINYQPSCLGREHSVWPRTPLPDQDLAYQPSSMATHYPAKMLMNPPGKRSITTLQNGLVIVTSFPSVWCPIPQTHKTRLITPQSFIAISTLELHPHSQAGLTAPACENSVGPTMLRESPREMCEGLCLTTSSLALLICFRTFLFVKKKWFRQAAPQTFCVKQ